MKDKSKSFPLLTEQQFLDETSSLSPVLNFVQLDCYSQNQSTFDKEKLFKKIKSNENVVLWLSSENKNAVQSIRRMFGELNERKIKNPAIIFCNSHKETTDESLIHFAIETGALLIDGFGNGIFLSNHFSDNK